MPGDFIRLDSVCNGGPFCVMSIDGKTVCICAEKKIQKFCEATSPVRATTVTERESTPKTKF